MARNNVGNSSRRHHFVRELHADGIVEFICAKSEENTADILTKSGTKAECDRHEIKLVNVAPEELRVKNKD